MEMRQISDLLAPFVAPDALSPVQMEQVSVYLELLLKWNAKTNLTAVRNPEDIITRHFGESFFAAKAWLKTDETKTIIDLGSGAGFPGLPMAIYAPGTKVMLIESQNKKSTFLKEVVRTLGLNNVEVFAGRGEDYRGNAALVTLRAVEKFGKALEAAVHLVAPDGRLGLTIGVGQQRELPPGFTWEVGNPVPGVPGRILATGSRNRESRE